MELMAVIAALESLKRDDLDIVIYSDSQYIVRAVQEGWLKNWIATNLTFWRQLFHSMHRQLSNWRIQEYMQHIQLKS